MFLEHKIKGWLSSAERQYQNGLKDALAGRDPELTIEDDSWFGYASRRGYQAGYEAASGKPPLVVELPGAVATEIIVAKIRRQG